MLQDYDQGNSMGETDDNAFMIYSTQKAEIK